MDNDTFSLFDDTEFQGQNHSARISLKIIVGRNKKLTKQQQTFNRLTKRIEELQGTIGKETAKLESLLKAYLTEIPEKRRTVANGRLEIAKALGGSVKNIKYGKRQYEDLRDVILILCNEAFVDVEPDEPTEAFYDKWAETSYKEETKCQIDQIKCEFADQARNIFGVDIDLDDIEDTPEGFARFANRLQDEFEELNRHNGNSNGRKKTKKQIEREKLQKDENKLTLKSVRKIYLSLAKALHPDTIMDPAEKARKEELMKQVTSAYADKDLHTLLKLEMEWIVSENAALGTLPDDKLKLYISSLKEQVAGLVQELHALYYHPRFAEMAEFSLSPESAARQQLRRQVYDYSRVITELNDVMTIFSKPEPKKEIIRFVNEYRKVINARNPFSEAFISNIF